MKDFIIGFLLGAIIISNFDMIIANIIVAFHNIF